VERVEAPEGVVAKVKAFVPARLIDLSPRGAQVEVAVSLQPRQGCALRLTVAGEELILPSTVRRCWVVGFGVDERSRPVTLFRAGLEFEPALDGSSEKLATFLADRTSAHDEAGGGLGPTELLVDEPVNGT
jgi:hypothetical protein